jgi:hypothetical protein
MHFIMGLKEIARKKLLSRRLPESFNNATVQATGIEVANFGPYGSRTSGGKPVNRKMSTVSKGDPMDLDKLEEMTRKVTCWNCEEEGHRADKCKKPLSADVKKRLEDWTKGKGKGRQ